MFVNCECVLNYCSAICGTSPLPWVSFALLSLLFCFKMLSKIDFEPKWETKSMLSIDFNFNAKWDQFGWLHEHELCLLFTFKMYWITPMIRALIELLIRLRYEVVKCIFSLIAVRVNKIPIRSYFSFAFVYFGDSMKKKGLWTAPRRQMT